MKKRVLSALLVLCLACGLVSTVWATETNATSGAPEPASQTLNLDNEQSGNESGADSTGAPSDSTDSTSASSDSTSSGSSSAASDATSDATSGEGDESAASSDSTAASDSTSSSSSASSDSSDSNADDQDAASSNVTGDESAPSGDSSSSDTTSSESGTGSESVPDEDTNALPGYAPEAMQANDGISTLALDSEFTITWQKKVTNNDATVTVELYDADTKEPITADVDAVNLTADGTWNVSSAPQTLTGFDGSTYTYSSAEYGTWQYDGWNRERDFTSVQAYEQRSNGRYSWRYSFNDGNARQTAYTIRLYYTKSESSVTITDSILTDGRLTAEYTGTKEGPVTYTWYRVTDDGEETPVVLDTGTNKLQNLGDNWVNVSLDVESLCYMLDDSTDALEQKNNIRSTHYTYEVVATIGEEEVGSASLSVPYFAQLMNGSFESPDNINNKVDEEKKHPYQVQYGNSYDDDISNVEDKLIWKSTGEVLVDNGLQTGDWVAVEILNASHTRFQNSSGEWELCNEAVAGTHNCGAAADGDQYAEINCEAYGALYQNVLTVPGSKLHWNLSHLPREVDNGKGDTMALVIVPARDAQTYIEEFDDASKKNDSTAEIRRILEDIKGKGEENGYFVKEITDNKLWEDNNKQWNEYSGTYTVGEDQFLTTFFFVAVDTASNDKTVGNLIDDVWFSPTLPTPDPDTGHLTVTKVVSGEGLTADQLAGYTVEIKVKEGDTTKTETISGFTQTSDGTFTASTTFQDLPTDTYTVTETVSGKLEGFIAGTSMYQIGSEVPQNGTTATVEISNGATTGLTFTNPYTKDEPAAPVNPEIRKYVDDNENGTYSLSLDVTGDVNVKESTVPLNVLYILDESYSMMWDMDGSYPDKDVKDEQGNEYNHGGDNRYAFDDDKDGKDTDTNIDYTTGKGGRGQYSYKRYIAAKDAIKTLNATLQANENLEVRVALVEFARGLRKESAGWQSLENFTIPDEEYSLFDTGTNYAAAFNEAANVLKNTNGKLPNANTIVIFITDGVPNRQGTDSDNSASTDAGIASGQEYLAEVVEALNPGDRIYAIGVSRDVLNEDGQNVHLDNLFYHEYVGEQYTDKKVVPDNIESGLFQSDDTAALNEYFRDIAAEVTGATYCTDVTITDTFSRYAQLVNAEASPVITIKKGANGESITATAVAGSKVVDAETKIVTEHFTFNDNGTQTLIYTYYPAGTHSNNATPEFTLDFPETYALHDDWTYTITVQIEPTETAYTEYAQNKEKPEDNGYGNVVGDSDTDVPGSDQTGWTSSGKPGFYSNTSATLQYDSGDKNDETKEYRKPVIQVTTGKLTITKAVSGLPDDTDVSGQEFSFTVTGKYANGDLVVGKYGGYTFDSEGKTTVIVQGIGSSTLTHLPEGTYTVTETTTGLPGIAEGYRFDHAEYKVGDQEISDVDVSAGSNSAITVTNVYTRNTQTLTVTKTVAGPMGDTSEDNTFSFVLKLKEGTKTFSGEIGFGSETLKYDTEREGYLFTLHHNETATFTIPYGLTATVEETDPKGYTPYWRVDYNADAQDQVQAQVSSGDSKPSEEQNGYKQGKTTDEITMDNNHVVDFRNFRAPVAPTGLESNHTTPYVLMITAAGMAGLALIGGIVARRVRRRRRED